MCTLLANGRHCVVNHYLVSTPKLQKELETAIMEDLEMKPDNMVAVPEFGPRPTCDLHDKEDEEEGGSADYTTTGVEKNVLKNGGIKKMVVKHGTDPSPQTPLFGDEVTGKRFPFFWEIYFFDSHCLMAIERTGSDDFSFHGSQVQLNL